MKPLGWGIAAFSEEQSEIAASERGKSQCYGISACRCCVFRVGSGQRFCEFSADFLPITRRLPFLSSVSQQWGFRDWFPCRRSSVQGSCPGAPCRLPLSAVLHGMSPSPAFRLVLFFWQKKRPVVVLDRAFVRDVYVRYSTVTLLARLRGWSTSLPR